MSSQEAKRCGGSGRILGNQRVADYTTPCPGCDDPACPNKVEPAPPITPFELREHANRAIYGPRHTAPPATPTEGQERCCTAPMSTKGEARGRWTIEHTNIAYGTQAPRWADTIHGPETPGIEVVPAAELERCRQERDEWRKSCEAAERDAALLRVAIREADKALGSAPHFNSAITKGRTILYRALNNNERTP